MIRYQAARPINARWRFTQADLDAVSKALKSIPAVAPYVDLAAGMFKYETYYDAKRGTYDVRSKGIHKGPGQFERKSWVDAFKAGGAKSVVDFGKFANTLYFSLLATALYVKVNFFTAKRFQTEFYNIHKRQFTGKITPVLAYLAHNQGARGAAKFLAGERNISNQSDAVKALFASTYGIDAYGRRIKPDSTRV